MEAPALGSPGRWRHRLGVGDHTGHLDGEVGGFDEGETLCFIGISDGEVGLQGRTPIGEGIFNTR